MARTKKVAKKVEQVRKATVKQYDTIVRPIITEKSMALMQSQNKVTVEVPADANKTAIKLAFEAVFNVKVENVNISNVRSEKTRRGGRYEGHVPGYKKAIVTVAEGDAIDLFKE
ncbi:MAG: 50S ribosomal protein L23 [Bacilli bacterium]|jgi:large subunit ribosomal protein L23|nr:50S ribosomal protein L23 [Bacilli bacterium]MDD3388983.1 50S ribosomal protein L23 [Bacilli bacterium]MDD4344422.1 50S ribosomal protein L23 [Bacilli bacterium]MDD4520674.1 50S ribosomal protein L23 [Bacilli bacterium]MDY0399351.1 50S ribosomal protein L23 [Bacilli bacterium]